ncbi:hypothetical protein PR202_gb01777 [Eleusine coracana subsp. coracana]|uniref:Uncharacterized protein n=1 Tax=Eleusine coracana subsp. coracana TaxID=191504 RepID=A0AAV5DXH6_ELECO|nr:hypothetical protein PR202_gb01777 [Eleusine coracana subsp. coracana]
MSACAGMMPTHAGAVGGRGGYHAPAMQAAASFSSRTRRTGADDDVEALIRAASRRQQASGRGGGEGGEVSVVPARTRSCVAVAVGRIDEDSPCEFGASDDVRVGGPAPVRRARSVAVGGAGLAKRANAGAGFGAAKRSAVHG